MRIEFIAWPENVEIVLFENLGGSEVVKDRIYTSAAGFIGTGWDLDRPVTLEPLFYALEEILPPPTIGGEWGKFHPYWAEREAKKKRREERGMQAPETNPHREHD